MPVFASLLTDKYPIQGRARIYSLYWMATADRTALRAVRRGIHRRRGRRRRRLALDVHRARDASPSCSRSCRSSSSGNRAAGRYEQELVLGEALDDDARSRTARFDVDRVRADEEDQDLLFHLHGHRRARVRARRRADASSACCSTTATATARTPAAGCCRSRRIASLLAIPIAGLRLRPAVPQESRARRARSQDRSSSRYGILLVHRDAHEGARVPLARSSRSPARARTPAFVSVGPIVGAVAPFRMRTQAFALIPVFIFLDGRVLRRPPRRCALGRARRAHRARRSSARSRARSAASCSCTARATSSATSRSRSRSCSRSSRRSAGCSDNPDEIPVLQIHNLDFSYGPVQVLFDVNLDLQKGEVLALLGTNGAGKSTLLRAISGLGIPDRGVVRLNGRTAHVRRRRAPLPARHRAAARWRRRVPRAERRRQPALFAVDVEAFTRAERQARIDRVLQIFPAIVDRRQVLAVDLSGGQQQMLALAMALVHEPEVLLIDELSLGLAPRRRRGAARRRAGPQGAGPDDDRRRAVAERRARVRRPRDLHGEGPGPLRGPGAASSPNETISSAPSSSVAREADRGARYRDHAAGAVLRRRLRPHLRGVRGRLRARLPQHRSPQLRAGRDRRVRRRAVRRSSTCSTASRTGSRSLFAVIATAIIGMVIELVVVRRLFDSPRLVLLIATVGVAQLLLFLRISLPDIETESGGQFPLPFTGQWHPTDSILVLPREILVLIDRAGRDHRPRAVHDPDVVRARGAGVGVELRHRPRLRDQRASAPRRSCGRSRPRSPPSPASWSHRCSASTPGNVVAAGAVAIGPSLLLRALVVALIARMQSLPMTIVGGIAVGVFERIVVGRTSTIADQNDRRPLPVHRRAGPRACSWSATAATTRAGRSRRRSKPIPGAAPHRCGTCGTCPQIGFTLLFGFLLVLPLFLTQRSQEFLWTDIVIFALVAMSIMPLAGWAGQLSLGQFAFVGLGALTMVVLRVGSRHPRAVRPLGHELPDGLVPGACICSIGVGVAAAIDHRHPRVARARPLPRRHHACLRGHVLELALRDNPCSPAASSARARRASTRRCIGSVDFSNRRSLYYLCLGVLIVTTLVVARLRRTGIGRSMIAVRDNEDMAAASTVAPSRIKVMSFALSGGIAALAGMPAHHRCASR